MSEQWLGLRNPDLHEVSMLTAAHCRYDFELCLPNRPCRCCLAAEVEVLRAQVSEEHDLRLAAQTRADAAEDQMEDAAKVIAATRAQVQRVREVCEQQMKDRSPWSDDREKHGLDRIDGWNDALDIVEQALDGATLEAPQKP